MRSTRTERGAVLPSPVVILSIVAVALAAITFFVTRGDGPKEKDVTPQATPPSATSTVTTPSTGGASATATPTEQPTKKPHVVVRGKVGVVVFNNTSTSGLAGQVGAKVAQLGWKFVTADNWYGTVPATTVYFPQGMRPAAKQLALDLGVQRVMPADVDSDMSTHNLTLILTGPLG
ncbi:LytR C-terminal domain-containing protein [Nocardioides montaniterrae]